MWTGCLLPWVQMLSLTSQTLPFIQYSFSSLCWAELGPGLNHAPTPVLLMFYKEETESQGRRCGKPRGTFWTCGQRRPVWTGHLAEALKQEQSQGDVAVWGAAGHEG